MISVGELKDNENNFIPFTGENNYAIPLELSTTTVNPEDLTQIWIPMIILKLIKFQEFLLILKEELQASLIMI